MGGLGSGRRRALSRPEPVDVPFILVSELYGRKAPRGGEPVVRRWVLADRSSVEITLMRAEIALGQVVACRSVREHPGGRIEKDEFDIYIDWTPCHLGGERASLSCPRLDCGRAARKLYLNDLYLLCWRCAQVPYLSKRLAPRERRGARAESIRARLGPRNSLGFYSRPKGMGMAEYRRLSTQLGKVEARIIAEFGSSLPQLEARVEQLKKQEAKHRARAASDREL